MDDWTGALRMVEIGPRSVAMADMEGVPYIWNLDSDRPAVSLKGFRVLLQSQARRIEEAKRQYVEGWKS